MRVEMGERQSVGRFVVHGQEDLPRLHGVRDERLGDERAALRLDDHALVRA